MDKEANVALNGVLLALVRTLGGICAVAALTGLGMLFYIWAVNDGYPFSH
ncbi:MAG: hypothetical protein AAB632_00425 [Patescibacteria group bacterium]